MTLAQLKEKAIALKIGGRVLPDNVALKAFQEMIFDNIIQLCEPLNLAIPYQDSEIYRPIDEDGDVEWFLKKPRIAEDDVDYIDIDSRLETAFVYYLIAFVANDTEKLIFERKADRMCVEYASDVLKMGLPRAKEVYEQESFVTSVRFDCVGRVYVVDSAFIDVVISCLLCGNVCMNAAQKKQLELYKIYLDNGAIRPMDVEALHALDRGVFLHLMDNMTDFASYSAEELSKVTTLFCEFENILNGDTVAAWITDIDTRLSLEIKG